MDTQLSPQQSLEIIQKMMNKAKFNFFEGSYYFIMWSFLLATAALYQFVALQLELPLSFLGWPVAGLIGGVLSYAKGAKSEPKATNQIERIYSSIWSVFFIGLILLIAALVINRINPTPYVLLVTGIPTVFTGVILKFKPLLFGGINFWTAGLIALFLPPQIQPLVFAVAILLGYFFPGYLMRQKTESDV